MPYDSAGYRDHCGKLHIFVSILDSPQNPSSNAAGCFSYEKGGRNGR